MRSKLPKETRGALRRAGPLGLMGIPLTSVLGNIYLSWGHARGCGVLFARLLLTLRYLTLYIHKCSHNLQGHPSKYNPCDCFR